MVGGGGGAATGVPQKTAEEIEDAKAIESNVDAAEWKLELERVVGRCRLTLPNPR
jgi:hypothetical protein